MLKHPLKIPAFIMLFTLTFWGCNNKKTQEDASEENTTVEVTKAPSDWIDLLSGNNLSQWRGYLKDSPPESGWVFDGNVLKLKREEGEQRGGDIITLEKFENFELVFEFKLLEQTNSGVFYQVIEREGQLIYYNAPEFQLLDNHFFLATSDLETMSTHLTGDLFDLYTSGQNLIKPLDSWNEGKLIMNNMYVEHWINGIKAISYKVGSDEWKEIVANSKFKEYEEFGLAKEGHIGLQDHGNEVWFRNIKIRRL